ncbi:PucR family transcriptional regulator [Brevibacillus sp. GCM10020057]|uniref:PucR family transcriptional regulator n=1 Tax=Brevibacillus sp. GCM10020057 TaxID=3317327 RepID=UPI003636D51A
MDQWLKLAEQIRLETGLPVACLQTSRSEANLLLREQESRGWEAAAVSEDDKDGNLWLLLIESSSWPPPARAMLKLLFAPPQASPEASLTDQIAAWLQSVVQGAPIAPPQRLEPQWSWREKRAVFLMERCRSESSFEWQSLESLLPDFFKAPPGSLHGFPLGRAYYLLLVPLSMLGNQCAPEDLLEWASGLHDLISTERMEHVRLTVSPPIETALALGKTLDQLLSLSRALTKYRPRVMVAGTWNYPLEQWASSLPAPLADQLARSLRSGNTALQLGAEQLETLETLFACQLNVSDTARRLYVHRNTLLYRLDKLTEQTGLDPRQFPDAVLLQLLLLFRQN